jgi:hypothetical protein
MMVLCPNHHDQVTKGAFDEVAQRQAKMRPYNIERGFAGGQLVVAQGHTRLSLGGYLFEPPRVS